VQADIALDEIRREKATPASLKYEADVTKQLDLIHTTAIGKLLFKSMKPTEKVWIVPTDNMGVDAVATTTPAPLSKAKGGGVRVHYDPVVNDSPDRYYAADDVLFHELVHAYRSGRWTRSTWRYERLKEYQSEEEFLAVYMTNVYRACRGDLSFYRTHINSELLSKDKIYDYLSTDSEAFYALKYFTENDKLAMQVAKFAVPLFNPWRDFSEIGKRFWKDYGRIGKKAPHLIDL